MLPRLRIVKRVASPGTSLQVHARHAGAAHGGAQAPHARGHLPAVPYARVDGPGALSPQPRHDHAAAGVHQGQRGAHQVSRGR